MSLQIVKSKYKHLIVSGCSFTHNRLQESHAWANLLADWAGMTISNLANTAAGNGHIANSIMLHMSRYNYNPADTLVLVMWSDINRSDWIVDQKLNLQPNQYRKNYDQYTEHYALGNESWGPDTSVINGFKKFQSNYSLALQSWLHMNNLSNYLETQNYNYYYTSFVDILWGKGLYKESFLKLLKDLSLPLNLNRWILTQHDSLGEYAIRQDMMTDDNHPTLEGHETWVKTNLITKLLEKQELYDLSV